jgi:hypothetical protein
MSRPIVLTGVINGKTIKLDEETCLPAGYRVTLHLILEPAEALRLAAGSWAELTPEDIADLEAQMTAADGAPFQVPENEGR